MLATTGLQQQLGHHQTAAAAETATQEEIASIRRTISIRRLPSNSKQQAGVLETAEMSATVYGKPFPADAATTAFATPSLIKIIFQQVRVTIYCC
jgi:hypothetical protein